MVCGTQGLGYDVGGLSMKCAAKIGCEPGCRLVGVMGLEGVGGLYCTWGDGR